MIHGKEQLIFDASKEHGLREVKPGVSYDSSTVEDLPTPLRGYWETKQKVDYFSESGGKNLKAAGDEAVNWIKENQEDCLKTRLMKWLF